jgi:hypothetical protein
MELSDSLPPGITAVPLLGSPCGPGCDGPGQVQGLPGPAHNVSVHARGLRPRQVRRTPCRSGVPAVAFRVFGARRHPGVARFRGSIPCLHIPLSTLHALRYRSTRMTRGQCGWLDLHCRRLALLHIMPVCPGTPERQVSAAARGRSAAEAPGSQLQTLVRLSPTPWVKTLEPYGVLSP